MSTIFRITGVILVACCSIYGMERYADEKIISHSGLYFENQGPIKIMTTKWSLVAFYDISSFRQRTKVVNNFIETTKNVCAHFQENKIFQTNCETNYALSKLLVHTAEEKKKTIFESVGHSRISKRGIPYKAIAKAAQILFGLCDRFCIQKTNNEVSKVTDSNNKEVNIVEKQVKIIQLERDEGSEVVVNIANDLAELRNMTSEANRRSFLAYHFIQINLILELYISETEILFDVIQAAKVGLIHPSLLTSQELLKQLLNIKVGMPSGTDLPIDLNENNVHEMIPLTDITIYYSNDKIVFILDIPLVYQYELTLYQLISIPVCNNNNCVYIKPSYKYLAVSKSKEMYSAYDEIDQSLCKRADDFLICPEIYPLHPRNGRPICEVLLLQEPKEVPDSCEIMQVQLRANLFHKLKLKNEWIYATPGETIFITCDQDKRSTNHFLEGVGKLYLNETCKAYATRDILIPHRIEADTELIDFIPNSRIKEPQDGYASLTTNILEDKHVRTNQMFDLNIVAKSTSEIKEIVTKEEKTEKIQTSKRRHDYLLYAIGAITGICVVILVIGYIDKNPRYIRNGTRKTRQDIRSNTETEMWHFQAPVQIEETQQLETNNEVPTTINTQEQIKDDIIPLPSAPEIKTRYSVYPTSM